MPETAVKPEPTRSRVASRKSPRGQVRRNLHRGNWLVQQVKSQIGAREEHHKTLADLGLLQIGRCALFDGERPEAWGQIVRVRHLVAVRPLTQQPSETPRAHKEAAVMKTVPYEIDGREARHYHFDGDSFMSVERFPDSVAVNWSTALPIATILDKLDSTLLGRIRAGVLFDTARRGHRRLEAAALIPELFADQGTYPFVRLECADMTIVWQRPAYPKHVDEDVRSGRLGILSSNFDAEIVAKMVRDTATPAVGALADELVADASGIHSRREIGH